MMRVVLLAAVLAAPNAGSASAETFRFPAAQAAHGIRVHFSGGGGEPPPWYFYCRGKGRWELEYPSDYGFWSEHFIDDPAFYRGITLRGNPSRGSYDVAVKLYACWEDYNSHEWGIPDVPRVYWHKVVVY
ncbi:hypothetical protein HFN45_16080 [Rhizobium leguminosarum]|nr:hypothetical protein [Rhizobium leguminosarum]